MHRRRKVDEKSCVTPAGTSNDLDVQNKWEENTLSHTHTHTHTHTQEGEVTRRVGHGAPVCRIFVSICCDKRRETSFTVPAESGRSGEKSCSCVHAHF